MPSAMHQTGAIFVIPHPLGKFDDVFMRWESITKIHVAMQGFTEVRNRRPDCTTCRRDLTAQSRAFCPKCNAITCALCAVPYFIKIWTDPIFEIK